MPGHPPDDAGDHVDVVPQGDPGQCRRFGRPRVEVLRGLVSDLVLRVEAVPRQVDGVAAMAEQGQFTLDGSPHQ